MDRVCPYVFMNHELGIQVGMYEWANLKQAFYPAEVHVKGEAEISNPGPVPSSRLSLIFRDLSFNL